MSYNPHPTHPGWWQIWYRPEGKKGKNTCLVVKTAKNEAEVAAIEADIRRETRPEYTISAFPRVDEVIPHYLANYRFGHLDTTNVFRHLNRWKSYVGKLRFAAINGVIVERYKSDRLNDGIAPATINKELSALSGLLKWAAEKGYCRRPDYIERFPARMTTAPLPDVPTRAEVLAVINGAIWPRCGLIACLYYGGLRKSEATGLRAEDVYLDRSVMIVRGKGNKQRVVPVVNELRPWLDKRIAEIGSGLLWTTKSGERITDVKNIINLAAARAGLNRHIYPHLLRHAFGTHSTMSGVGLRTLQKVMGHTSSRTTEIYTTLSDSAIIEELTGKFGR